MDKNTPSYYRFNIKGMDIDVNDINIALSNKMPENKENIDSYEYKIISEIIQYITRSAFKGQYESDIKKINHLSKVLLEYRSEKTSR